MTRFEEIGMAMQLSSRSEDEANKMFDRSCQICCTRNMCSISCDHCAIDVAHNKVLQAFAEPSVKLKINLALGIPTLG